MRINTYCVFEASRFQIEFDANPFPRRIEQTTSTIGKDHEIFYFVYFSILFSRFLTFAFIYILCVEFPPFFSIFEGFFFSLFILFLIFLQPSVFFSLLYVFIFHFICFTVLTLINSFHSFFLLLSSLLFYLISPFFLQTW